MCSVEEGVKIEGIIAKEEIKDISIEEKRKQPDSNDTNVPDKVAKVEENDSNSNDEKSRKKPGRKPATTEPTNKRVAQNRAAQRAFRERKENYVKVLESKIDDLEKTNKEVFEENKKLQEKLAYFEKRSKEIQEEFPTTIELKDFSSLTAVKEKESSTTPTEDRSSSLDLPASLTSDGSNNKSSSPEGNNSGLGSFNTGDSSLETPLIKDSLPQNAFTALPYDLNSTPLFGYTNNMDFNALNYGIPLFNDPLSSMMPSLTQNPYLMQPNLNNDFATATDLSGLNAYDPNGLNNMNFMNFDPILFADHALAYDPLSAGLSSDANSLNPTIAQGQEFMNQQLKNYVAQTQAPKEEFEFDLDNLCSIMKEKAQCSERKKFLNNYCQNKESS